MDMYRNKHIFKHTHVKHTHVSDNIQSAYHGIALLLIIMRF